MATQGEEVHSSGKSLCGFDGDDDDDIGGDNELSSIADQIPVVQTVNSLGSRLKEWLLSFHPTPSPEGGVLM